MAARPTVEELQAKHHNEDIHTDHVARLAVGMFEQSRAAFGLDARERVVLETAARLHELGYAEGGARRAERGAELIAGEGVAGLSDTECRLAAAIVLLQQPEYAAGLAHPIWGAAPQPDCALRLAAYVRVADGLDHGHLQDVKIKDLEVGAARARLKVRGLRYAGNLEAAQQKADLWRRAFALDMDVTGKLKSTGARYQGIVKAGDTVLEGVRRMLSYEYRIMEDTAPGMRDGEGTDPLHDFRVALRRFRALLRQFRRPLEATSAAALNRRLAELGDALSAARDVDATWEFLTQPSVNAWFEGDPDWLAYLEHLEQARRDHLPEVRRIVDAPAFADIMRQSARLLRVELPDRQREAPPAPLRGYALNQVRRIRKRMQGVSEPSPDASAEEMHELRRLCRRYRYWSESLAPIVGGPVHEYAKLFKALSDALGGLNDMNVYLDRLARQPPSNLPARLPEYLQSRRTDCRDAFQAAWARVQRKKLRRDIIAIGG